jgi:hypothetical protein
MSSSVARAGAGVARSGACAGARAPPPRAAALVVRAGPGKSSAPRRENQANPNNSEYWQSRTGRGRVPADWKERHDAERARQNAHADNDNRANQLNPEHPAYYSSRGLATPPGVGADDDDDDDDE